MCKKMTITTLEKSPKFKQELIELIESSFQYSEDNHFDIDFYPLISPANQKNCYIMLDEDKTLIGHVGVLPKTITNDQISTQVTFIGGIVIDPKFQGRGHFRELLNHVIKINEKKSALFILWGHLYELYQKFDFYPAIGMLEHATTLPSNNNLEKTILANLNQEDKDQIIQLYNDLKKDLTIVSRNKDDWKNIERIVSSDLFIKRDSEGGIEFYFFKNKGQDLPEVVHEFGYKNPLAKEELFNTLKNETSWLPENERKNFADAQLCSSALIRVGDCELFKQYVEMLSNNQIQILNISQQEIEFEFNENLYDMKISDFLPLILGPNPALEFADFGKPVFIAGLDSI